MKIETRVEFELLRSNVARIVIITNIDGEEMKQQFMIGRADLVEAYYKGEITLEEYKEQSRRVKYFLQY